MALTDDDKQWIKGAIVEGISESYEVLFAPRFDEIDKRFNRVDEEIRELKERVVALEASQRDLVERLGSVEGGIEALRNDILEIYNSIYKKPSKSIVSAGFDKLSTRDKIVIMQEQIQKLAKETGVTLPSIKTV